MSDEYERKEKNKIRLSERNAESAANGIRVLEQRLGELGLLILEQQKQIVQLNQQLQAFEGLLQNHNIRMVGHGPTE
jgi:hypothetical protein